MCNSKTIQAPTCSKNAEVRAQCKPELADAALLELAAQACTRAEKDARVQRMQKRADDASLCAAQAHARCEEKKVQLQHLVIEIDAQQSNGLEEAFNSLPEVSKRVDSLQLTSWSSPSQRFAHQLDLISGTRQVVDKLQQRIDNLQKHCGQCGEDLTGCSCNCIHCWEVRAKKKHEMAVTLGHAAEALYHATEATSHPRGQSVGAMKASSPTKQIRSPNHLRALQEAASLLEVSPKGASVEAKTKSSCPLMRRATLPSSPSQAATQAGKPAMKLLTRGYPRSKSCLHSNHRRTALNNDF